MSAAECPIDGCDAGRQSNQLMCRRHWYRVPVEIRKRVWATARAMHAEEELGGPAYQEWRETRGEAIAAVELKEAGAA